MLARRNPAVSSFIVWKNLPASAGCGKFLAYGREQLKGAIPATPPDVWPNCQASGVVHAFRDHLDDPAHPASAAPAGAWACVRLGVAACATWLGWRYKHAGAGVASLVGALLLFAFSLLVRAKPVVKSADALAAELSALIVLNGGIFLQSPDSTPIHRPKFLFILNRSSCWDRASAASWKFPWRRCGTWRRILLPTAPEKARSPGKWKSTGWPMGPARRHFTMTVFSPSTWRGYRIDFAQPVDKRSPGYPAIAEPG